MRLRRLQIRARTRGRNDTWGRYLHELRRIQRLYHSECLTRHARLQEVISMDGGVLFIDIIYRAPPQRPRCMHQRDDLHARLGTHLIEHKPLVRDEAHERGPPVGLMVVHAVDLVPHAHVLRELLYCVHELEDDLLVLYEPPAHPKHPRVEVHTRDEQRLIGYAHKVVREGEAPRKVYFGRHGRLKGEGIQPH